MNEPQEGERVQVSPRILKQSATKLTQEAKRRNFHPNTYFALVLDKHAQYLVSKTDLIIADKNIIKATYCDPEKVEEQVEEQVERKFAEWLVSEEEISLDNFIRRLERLAIN